MNSVCKFLLLLQITTIMSTDRPIIGVLTQGLGDTFQNLPEASQYRSFIASSYVKWLEGAGAQVVPIIVDAEDTEDQAVYFEEMFHSINGLVIPGGADKLNTSGYSRASFAFFQMAKEANEAGDIFPILGICLGFEMFGLITNEGQPYLTRCNSRDQAVPLIFEEGFRESRLFGEAPEEIIDNISKLPLTINFHHWCLTKENFTKFGMEQFWNVLSVNSDLDGLEFISSMEAWDYPFYGVQFHPEKK